MQIFKSLIILIFITVLSACGGGGDPSPASNELVWDDNNWNEKNWK